VKNGFQRIWRDAIELRDQVEATKVQFILTELDVALTFCHRAASTNDDENARRNTRNARKAYDCATHFLASAELTPKIRKDIEHKVKRLKSLLRSLGEADIRDFKGAK